jgi:ABC-type lipoprotein release transport system permease subunit
MRDRNNRLAPLRRRRKGPNKDVPNRLTPLNYILRETWRKRSRTLMSVAGIASLTLLFILFSSMDAGLDEYFENETEGAPSEESKELYEVKQVMDDWVYLITVLCLALMFLVIANTAIITVVERRFELASLRALGISSLQVSYLVIGSMTIIITAGLIAGLLFGSAIVPLLDYANLSLGGNVDLPLVLDPISFVTIALLGLLSGGLGLIAPLMMIIRSSPLEVLRNAG